ncbi:MAG: Gfo/Idh/MocA family oxidoreductase [Gemmataceae bacterium]|nr:Gfo/Idh/MocA family oxidoreductase [Gemmataceae bacterium]
MAELRVAVAGAGFWAGYQTAAWGEVPGVRVVAVSDPDRAKAERLAARLGGTAYADPADMLDRERPDLLDVIAAVPAHLPLVRLAVGKRVPVVCQKPLAATPAECEEMVRLATDAGVWFAVHENWRWQAPLRRIKDLLAAGAIGTPFRARLDFVSGFDIFANQPTLKDDPEFAIADVGCHLLDLARSYFGEADRLYCQAATVRPDIRGEDVASVHMRMGGRVAVTVNLGYAGTPLERESFPETLLFVEGDRGSIAATPGCWVRVTTAEGTHAARVPPPFYPWADPRYAVVHSSMAPCLAHLAEAVRAGRTAETDGADYLRSMGLVFAAYESARSGQVVTVPS